MTEAQVEMNRGNEEGFRDKAQRAIAEMELAIEAKEQLNERVADLY
jgi:hypothetical protein